MRLDLFTALACCFCIFKLAAAPSAGSNAATADTLAPRGGFAAIDSSRTASDSSTVISAARPKGKSAGISEPVSYEADAIDYDMEKRVLHLHGNAVVRYQDVTLFADSIQYLIEPNLFVATGHPQLVDRGDTTVGESMTYNIKTRRGSVRYASTHMDDAFFNSQRIVKGRDNSFFAHNGDYTTCATPDTPHYYFYAKDIKVLPNDKAYARPAVFNIAETPVAALPFLILPLDRSRTSGVLTPAFGGHPGANFYLDNVGYYWAPNDYMDFTFASKMQEFSSFVLSGATRYALRYWLSGGLGVRYTLASDYRKNAQQWAIDYSHNQTITPDNSLALSGRGNLVSSSNFYKSFSEDTTELLNKQISANLELSKRFTSINASGNASWTRSQNLIDNSITEDLPSLRFSLPSRSLIPEKPRLPNDTTAPKWFNKIFYSYSAHGVNKRFVRPEAVIDQERDYMRKGAEQSLSLSYAQKVLRYFDFSPNFNARMCALDAFKDTIPDDTIVVADTLTKKRFREDIPDSFWTLGLVLDTIFFTDTLDQPDTHYVVVDSIVFDTTLFFKPNQAWTYDYAWNVGASLATTLYGTFPMRILTFTGLRHTMRPSVGYTFTPKKDNPRPGVSYYDIGIPKPAAQRQSQRISFNVANDFHGRIEEPPPAKGEKPVEKKFPMLSVNLGAGYDLEAKGPKWSDLTVSANTSNKFFSISYGSSFWLYDEHGRISYPLLRSYDVRISPQFRVGGAGVLWNGNWLDDDTAGSSGFTSGAPMQRSMQPWQLNLAPAYSFSQSRASPSEPFVTRKNYTLSASANLNFTRIWTASWSSYYNFVANQFVGHSFNFRCDLECWDMRFNWRPSGVNPGFYFIIQIKKIPEIKWEKRD